MRITMAGTAEVNGAKVLLGDVATIAGGADGLVGKLNRIYIARAPLPGKDRQIGIDAVKVRLKQNDVDPDGILIDGPERTQVVRSHAIVTGTQLMAAVRGFLEKNLLHRLPEAKIKAIDVPERMLVPKGRLSYRMRLLDHAAIKRHVPVHVHLAVNDGWSEKILAMVELEILTEVVVARRSLKRGWRVTADDCFVKTMDISELPSNIIRDSADVLGMRTSKAVTALSVFRTDMVEQPMLVRRGDIVQIIAESERLKVCAMGKIKGLGGRKDDRVQVINIDSEKSVYARVVDAKTVRVEYIK